MCDGCGIVHEINVDGTIYNYVIRKIDPGCLESWCQTRRATIEIAPKRYKNLYSDKEITEQDIRNYLTNHN